MKSVGDIEGPWQDPNFPSGLIKRCEKYWTVPLDQLPDVMVATYLNQQIAVAQMIEEAQRRVDQGKYDDTELYEGQLADTLEYARTRRG